MIKKNTIDYDSLWYYLDQEGEYFISKLVNEDVVYKHESFEYIQSEKKLFISGTVLTIKNENIMDAFYEFEIKKFQGTKKLDSLNIKKYNELEIYNFLIGETLLKAQDKEKKIKELLRND